MQGYIEIVTKTKGNHFHFDKRRGCSTLNFTLKKTVIRAISVSRVEFSRWVVRSYLWLAQLLKLWLVRPTNIVKSGKITWRIWRHLFGAWRDLRHVLQNKPWYEQDCLWQKHEVDNRRTWLRVLSAVRNVTNTGSAADTVLCEHLDNARDLKFLTTWSACLTREATKSLFCSESHFLEFNEPAGFFTSSIAVSIWRYRQ